MSRFFEAMPQSSNLRCLVGPVVSLSLLFLAEAEIITEHGLERFTFPMFKLVDVRWYNCSKCGSNFFHSRMLPPCGQRQHLNDHFP
jgi:hypothetical protein